MPHFSRILIANRGEIAVRIMRACREAGITTVAVYSEADRHALHARTADVALPIGPAPATQSYLNSAAIIAAAQISGATAIHPGYGFLSENPDFAEACAVAGITFIGPPPAAIRLMGSKSAAKAVAIAAGVPTVPGYQGDNQTNTTLLAEAMAIGFPVMIKAAAGGGGKGMRAVHSERGFLEALAAAQREAQAAFGDATVLLEKLLVHPRHIEFQIMGDTFGTYIHLGERECSVQRRHQKIIEEAPSVALNDELRATMGLSAIRIAQASGYVNAGTIEFLLDDAGNYYFLEMNTRLQVEHPVTEQVTGRDLVHMQIAIAAGMPLQSIVPFTSPTARRPAEPIPIVPRGHAIEVRLYAEDPTTYLPATGTVLAFDVPRSPGVRLDSGAVAGDAASMYYDPLLAKIIVTADDRPTALARLQATLDHVAILGVTTNLPLLRHIIADAVFQQGNVSTDYLDNHGPFVDEELSLEQQQLLIMAVGLVAREQSRQPSPQVRSPWSVGAMQSNRTTTRYQVGSTAWKLTIQAESVGASAVTAWLNDVQVALDIDAMDQPIAYAYDRDRCSLLIRHNHQQRTVWVAQQPEDNTWLVTDGVHTLAVRKPAALDMNHTGNPVAAVGGARILTAPMAGTVIQVRATVGDMVTERQSLVIMTAMKMEHTITAPLPAKVVRVLCHEGDVVKGGTALIELLAE